MRCGVLAVVSLAVLAGCTTVKPRMGFEDVQWDLAVCSGFQVHWNTGSPADDNVRAGEVTADQAVQIALRNHHELQATYEELNIAQADLVEAGLLQNPAFSGDLRFDTVGGRTGVTLGLAQDFVSLLMMPLAKGRFQPSFEGARTRGAAAVLDAAFETRTSLYECQAAEQLRDMRGTVLQATGSSYDLAKRPRAAGNGVGRDERNERDGHGGPVQRYRDDRGLGQYNKITMGGMFTILRVQENLSSYEEKPDWYAPSEGTLSDLAPGEVLDHNGINSGGSSAHRAPEAATKSWSLPDVVLSALSRGSKKARFLRLLIAERFGDQHADVYKECSNDS